MAEILSGDGLNLMHVSLLADSLDSGLGPEVEAVCPSWCKGLLIGYDHHGAEVREGGMWWGVRGLSVVRLPDETAQVLSGFNHGRLEPSWDPLFMGIAHPITRDIVECTRMNDSRLHFEIEDDEVEGEATVIGLGARLPDLRVCPVVDWQAVLDADAEERLIPILHESPVPPHPQAVCDYWEAHPEHGMEPPDGETGTVGQLVTEHYFDTIETDRLWIGWQVHDLVGELDGFAEWQLLNIHFTIRIKPNPTLDGRRALFVRGPVRFENPEPGEACHQVRIVPEWERIAIYVQVDIDWPWWFPGIVRDWHHVDGRVRHAVLQEIHNQLSEPLVLGFDPDDVCVADDGEGLRLVRAGTSGLALHIDQGTTKAEKQHDPPRHDGSNEPVALERGTQGRNYARAVVRPVPGFRRNILDGGRHRYIHPEVRLVARSNRPSVGDVALTEFTVLPPGEWSVLSGEVPFHAQQQTHQWPLHESHGSSTVDPGPRIFVETRSPEGLMTGDMIGYRARTQRSDFACWVRTGNLRRHLDDPARWVDPGGPPDAPGVGPIDPPGMGPVDRPGGGRPPFKRLFAAHRVSNPAFVVHTVDELEAALDSEMVFVSHANGGTGDFDEAYLLEPAAYENGSMLLYTSEKSRRSFSSLCEASRLGEIDIEPMEADPIVYVDSLAVDFAEETMSDLGERERSILPHGEWEVSVGRDGETRQMIVLAPPVEGEVEIARAGGRLWSPGWIEADIRAAVIRPWDGYWSEDGTTYEQVADTPSLEHYLDDDGRWLVWRGERPRLNTSASSRLIGAADLPDITLSVRQPVPTEEPAGRTSVLTYSQWDGSLQTVDSGRWVVDRPGGMGYESMFDWQQYRHRLGISFERVDFLGMDALPVAYRGSSRYLHREPRYSSWGTDETEEEIGTYHATPSHCYSYYQSHRDHEAPLAWRVDHIVAALHRIEIAESGLSEDIYSDSFDEARIGDEGRSARILDINPGLLFRGLPGVAVVPDLWGDEEGFEAWVPMQGPREEEQ